MSRAGRDLRITATLAGLPAAIIGCGTPAATAIRRANTDARFLEAIRAGKGGTLAAAVAAAVIATTFPVPAIQRAVAKAGRLVTERVGVRRALAAAVAAAIIAAALSRSTVGRARTPTEWSQAVGVWMFGAAIGADVGGISARKVRVAVAGNTSPVSDSRITRQHAATGGDCENRNSRLPSEHRYPAGST